MTSLVIPYDAWAVTNRQWGFLSDVFFPPVVGARRHKDGPWVVLRAMMSVDEHGKKRGVVAVVWFKGTTFGDSVRESSIHFVDFNDYEEALIEARAAGELLLQNPVPEDVMALYKSRGKPGPREKPVLPDKAPVAAAPAVAPEDAAAAARAAYYSDPRRQTREGLVEMQLEDDARRKALTTR